MYGILMYVACECYDTPTQSLAELIITRYSGKNHQVKRIAMNWIYPNI